MDTFYIWCLYKVVVCIEEEGQGYQDETKKFKMAEDIVVDKTSNMRFKLAHVRFIFDI